MIRTALLVGVTFLIGYTVGFAVRGVKEFEFRRRDRPYEKYDPPR